MRTQNGFIRNQKGIISIAAAAVIALVGVILLFVPNPVSTVAGIGVKPNTIVQKQSHTETLVPVKVNGQEVGFKTVTNDTIDNSDKAPKSWINDLLALPRLWILLMLAGCFCPALGLFMGNLNGKIKTVAQTAYNDLTGKTKQIVVGVKRGLDVLPTTPIDYRQQFMDALSKSQDSATENLVKDLLKNS